MSFIPANIGTRTRAVTLAGDKSCRFANFQRISLAEIDAVVVFGPVRHTKRTPTQIWPMSRLCSTRFGTHAIAGQAFSWTRLRSVVRSLLIVVVSFCLLAFTSFIPKGISPIVSIVLLVILVCEGFNLIYRSFAGQIAPKRGNPGGLMTPGLPWGRN
jgi:hypothetical protein